MCFGIGRKPAINISVWYPVAIRSSKPRGDEVEAEGIETQFYIDRPRLFLDRRRRICSADRAYNLIDGLSGESAPLVESATRESLRTKKTSISLSGSIFVCRE